MRTLLLALAFLFAVSTASAQSVISIQTTAPVVADSSLEFNTVSVQGEYVTTYSGIMSFTGGGGTRFFFKEDKLTLYIDAATGPRIEAPVLGLALYAEAATHMDFGFHFSDFRIGVQGGLEMQPFPFLPFFIEFEHGRYREILNDRYDESTGFVLRYDLFYE